MRERVDEGRPRLLVHGEVEVALAVSRLGVLQPVVDVGQRPLDLGERDQLVHGEGRLPTPRSGGCADGSDDVAEVDVDRARAILGAEQLDAPRPIHEVEERELSVAAPSEHPTGDTPARLGFLTRLEPSASARTEATSSRSGNRFGGAHGTGEPTAEPARSERPRHDVIMTLDRRHVDVIMTSWNSHRTSRLSRTASPRLRRPATTATRRTATAACGRPRAGHAARDHGRARPTSPWRSPTRSATAPSTCASSPARSASSSHPPLRSRTTRPCRAVSTTRRASSAASPSVYPKA